MQIAQNKNKPGSLTRWVLILLVFPVFILAVIQFYPDTRDPWHLAVAAPAQGLVLHSIPVEKNDIFELSYIHSVSRQEVRGNFIIDEAGLIRPLTTSFDSFGPGLPDFDQSTEYETVNGSYIVHHDEDPRASIRLFVSPLTGETLSLHGKKYDLSAEQENPFLVEIRICAGK